MLSLLFSVHIFFFLLSNTPTFCQIFLFNSLLQLCTYLFLGAHVIQSSQHLPHPLQLINSNFYSHTFIPSLYVNATCVYVSGFKQCIFFSFAVLKLTHTHSFTRPLTPTPKASLPPPLFNFFYQQASTFLSFVIY